MGAGAKMLSQKKLGELFAAELMTKWTGKKGQLGDIAVGFMRKHGGRLSPKQRRELEENLKFEMTKFFVRQKLKQGIPPHKGLALS